MTMNERSNAAEEHGPVPHPDLGAYVLGSLTADEQASFEQTMARDPALRREVDELRDVPRLLALAALVDGDGEDDIAVPAPVIELARPASARRRPGLLMAAAAAIALLLGIAGGIVATRTRSAGPDREVALALVEGAPSTSARGTAALYRQRDGVGVRLRMSGLTPTEPGARYECWWVGKNGRVAAGSFQVGADGASDVRLTVAASLDGPFKININKVANGTETRVLTAEAA